MLVNSMMDAQIEPALSWKISHILITKSGLSPWSLLLANGKTHTPPPHNAELQGSQENLLRF